MLTEKGYVPIEQAHNMKVWNGLDWAEAILHGGEMKEAYSIDTNSGEFVGCPNHPYMTTEGWKELQDLSPGDKILKQNVYAPGGDWWGEEDLAKFMGLIIGDGNYSQPHKNGSLVVGQREKDLLDWLLPRLADWDCSKRMLEKHGGYQPNLRQRVYNGKTSYTVVAVRSKAIKLLESKGLELKVTAYDKSIPDSVFSARPEVRASVLSGLFTSDGGITGGTKEGFCVSFVTVSTKLAYGVYRLLGSLGIGSKVRKYTNRRTVRNISYRVEVDRYDNALFQKLVGFMSLKKQKLLDVAVAYNDCLNDSSKKPEESKFAIVKSVTSLGTSVKMYDLCVYGSAQAYVADGLLVHNCLGSDITLIQAARIRRWIEENDYQDVVKICNLVHDSIWFYIKISHAHLYWELKALMEDMSSFWWKMDVPLVVEGTVGYDLAQSMGLDSQKEEQEQLFLELGLKKAA